MNHGEAPPSPHTLHGDTAMLASISALCGTRAWDPHCRVPIHKQRGWGLREVTQLSRIHMCLSSSSAASSAASGNCYLSGHSGDLEGLAQPDGCGWPYAFLTFPHRKTNYPRHQGAGRADLPALPFTRPQEVTCFSCSVLIYKPAGYLTCPTAERPSGGMRRGCTHPSCHPRSLSSWQR